MNKVLIIGGGLAGVSAGYHLPEHEPLLFERENEIGGLCRSFTQDGFTFDCTGHLVHLRNPYTKDLIAQLLPDTFHSHERLAAIYSKSVTTPYPFQANTYGLPAEVIKECIVGFVESLNTPGGTPANFHDWIIRTFGDGIARHFMIPYNEKFWKQDLHTITSDWVSWSIPKPSLDEVVSGALGLTNKGMGYNPRFIYPKSGGIDCLPRAFARSIRHIETGAAIAAIDGRRKYVRLENGREEPYDVLISTLPLPVLFRLLTDAPDDLRHDAARLRAVSVLNFNIGVARPRISNQHWIYFPENEYIFSRVGFPMNFSDAAGPAGASSVYIEITHQPRETPNLEEAFDRAIADLQRCGILRPDDVILTRHVLDIEFAYVVFDEHRQRCLGNLIEYLESRDIFTSGRYGRWDYYSMEDSILSGKAAAERALAKITAVRSPA